MSNSKSNQKLEIGDVVKLKSGGPKMTVTSVEEESFHCYWFAGEYDKVHFDHFPIGSLKKLLQTNR